MSIIVLLISVIATYLMFEFDISLFFFIDI